MAYGGEFVALQYDAMGRPLGEAKAEPNGSLSTWYRKALNFSAGGAVTRQEIAGGAVTETTELEEATGIVRSVRAARGTELLRETSYTYDHFLNLAKQSKTLPVAGQGTAATVVEEFAYDDLQRLTSQTQRLVSGATTSQTYTYDVLGNLTSKSDYNNGAT